MSAIINYDYYEGKDVYNDGDIEQILIDEFKKDINYTQDEYKDLAYFYLLTPIRQNILNWYPFDKNASVLEIGPGAGTITGMLCDRVKSVTVVEASKRRGELIYYRHNNKDNLNIIVGNFNDIKFETKFDYIVMVGVLEYGQIFSTGDNPYQSFLENITKHLTKKGKMLVAIENKNGLKYWCGANEDHLGKPYVGIEGYKEGNIRTFGKKELETLIKKSGFKYTRFYYPFPDYKIPYAVYTDDRLPNAMELKNDLLFNHDDAGFFTNPLEAVDDIVDNDLVGYFANSFLVEASMNEKIEKIVDYAKLNTNRNKPYATITKINNSGNIIKESMYEEGIEHLKKMAKTHKEIKNSGLHCCDVEYKNKTLNIEKIAGETVTNTIRNLLEENKKVEIEQLIDDVFNYIENNFVYKEKTNNINNKIFKIVNKDEEVKVLKMGLIDLNFSNIIINKNKYVLIDQEWVTDDVLPFDYIVYFSLKLLYEQVPDLEGLISYKSLTSKYKIDAKKAKEYDNLSKYFFFDVNNVFNEDTYKILLNRKIIKNRLEEYNKKQEEIDNLLQQLDKTRKDVVDRDETVIFLNKEVVRLNELIREQDKRMQSLKSSDSLLTRIKRKLFKK